jgi:hypothetical protein
MIFLPYYRLRIDSPATVTTVAATLNELIARAGEFKGTVGASSFDVTPVRSSRKASGPSQ